MKVDTTPQSKTDKSKIDKLENICSNLEKSNAKYKYTQEQMVHHFRLCKNEIYNSVFFEEQNHNNNGRTSSTRRILGSSS